MPTHSLGLAAGLAVATVVGACGESGNGAQPAGSTLATTSTTAAVTTTTVAEPRVVAEVLTRDSTTPAFKYELRYPVVERVESSVAAAVNGRLAAWANEQVDRFARAASGPADPGFGPPESELDGDFEVTLLDSRIMSVLVQWSEFYAGAAHPNGFGATFTFDLSTGRQLALADLFVAGSQYLTALSEESRTELNETYDGQYDDFVNPGTTAVAANFSGWHLGPRDLLISFDQYQVAPGVAGRPMIAIPYTQLREVIAPGGPLGGRI